MAHPGYTYRLRDDVAAEVFEQMEANDGRSKAFFGAIREWADELADELDLIGWARERKGGFGRTVPVPFDPDEHENKGTDDDRPHVLEIQVYQRSFGKPYIGELRGLPAIHPDDYPGEDAEWPYEDRRSTVPEGWYRYAKDDEVKVHRGGRTKAAKAARERAASLIKMGPRHPRDIVMEVATVPTNHFSYPGVSLGEYPGVSLGEGVVLMNSKTELKVKDGEDYRVAREGDPVFPVPLSEYLEISAQIAREREAS